MDKEEFEKSNRLKPSEDNTRIEKEQQESRYSKFIQYNNYLEEMRKSYYEHMEETAKEIENSRNKSRH